MPDAQVRIPAGSIFAVMIVYFVALPVWAWVVTAFVLGIFCYLFWFEFRSRAHHVNTMRRERDAHLAELAEWQRRHRALFGEGALGDASEPD
jgi:hypothetical protein